MEPDFFKNLAERHSLVLTAPPAAKEGDEPAFYLQVANLDPSRRSERPSHRNLAAMREEAKRSNVKIEFLIFDPDERAPEEGLRASLISSFPDYIRNSFWSNDRKGTSVWLDVKQPLSSQRDKIDEHIKKYFELFAKVAPSIHVISEENAPTQTEILQALRLISPAGCAALRDRLQDKGLDVPSLDWLNRKLDALRKAGMVVRQDDRTYVLSEEGLHRLGTRKNRHSPDVSRLLALARAHD